jgi:hypothetical protein
MCINTIHSVIHSTIECTRLMVIISVVHVFICSVDVINDYIKTMILYIYGIIAPYAIRHI